MDLPPNWTRYTTDDGKEYFHNSITNTTQWERPVGRPSAAQTVAPSNTESVYQPSINELDLNDNQNQVSKNDGKMTSTMGSVTNPAADGMNFAAVSLSGGPGGDMQPLKTMNEGTTGGPSGTATGSGLFPMSGLKVFSCFDLSYWQTLFDVNTDDVIRRTKSALIPKISINNGTVTANPESVQDYKTKPDLWGPFWICTTLVVFLSATGNLGQLLSIESSISDTNSNAASESTSSLSNGIMETDWELVTLAAGMMYGALFGVPMILYGMQYFFGTAGSNSSLPNTSLATPVNTNSSLQHMMCAYGYSFIPLLPVSILMLIPSGLWKWLVCILGCAVSSVFVKTHLWENFSETADTRVRYAKMGLLFGTHVLIYLTYRISFFSPKISSS